VSASSRSTGATSSRSKKMAAVAFAAPVISSFAMDRVALAGGQSQPNQTQGNQTDCGPRQRMPNMTYGNMTFPRPKFPGGLFGNMGWPFSRH
jgi:hypothetical protein